MKKFTKKGLSLLLIAILSLSFNLAFALSEKRQTVVDYMYEMANVPWTAGRNMEFWDDEKGRGFKSGKMYFGIPYSQSYRKTNLERFNDLLIDGMYYGKSEFLGHTVVEGSDCSSAVSMAWQKLNEDIPYLSTHGMIPTSTNHYIVKVGDYEVPEKATTSTEVIEENIKEDIYKAYSKLQPGDAVVTRRKCGGHVILVRKVDVENQVVIGIDQEGVDEDAILLGKNGKSSWKDDRILPFDELYSKDYIPITIKELADKD